MKLKGLLFIILLCGVSVSAQLSNFNLQVTKTDETCLGNGTLAFTVSNLTPNASVLYKVYALPNTTNPVSVLTANTLGGLEAGTYRVVALQSLGSLLNSKEQDITIVKNIVPFNFGVAAQGQGCSGGGTIVVTTTSGIAASYEIITGPVQRPLQTSNTFTNLPSGNYNIRAFNNCGIGRVKTFTLNVVSSQLNISPATYSEQGITCDAMTIMNTITPSSGTINYPVNVRYELMPMTLGGESIVISQTYATGSPDSLTISATVPRLEDAYDYELSVTDVCNTPYLRIGEVNPEINVTLGMGDAPCAEKFLTISPERFTTSYTVNFISAPAGFDPSAFNATNGPFTEATVNYGSAENPVPFGTYEVEITDICGRTAIDTLLIKFIKPKLSLSAANNGCFSEYGKIRASVEQQRIVSAIIIAAPATYNQTLPQDVSVNINAQGKLTLNNMPLGVYVIKFVDDCGFEYEKSVEVPPYVEKPFTITTLPSCEAGFGGVSVKSGNGKLTAVTITAAPAAFNHTLPYSVSNHIDSEGAFYMAGLSQGAYVFSATDICGVVKEQSVTVQGYLAPQNSFSFIPKCGNFSVTMSDGSNGLEGASFWLQKFNPATGKWGHPGNNNVYTEGTVPVASNSVKLNNNATRNNLNYSGKFRIVKKFETFSTGSSENSVCISVLGEFEYVEGFSINNAYSLACVGTPNDVMLDVTGYPVAYRIIEKNGAAIVINNGLNNVFTNLQPAEYVFEIEDLCGNIVTKWFNVQELPSIADAQTADDMIICAEAGTVQNHEFRLADQNDDILGPLHSAMYTITYHLTIEDADNGVNALPEYYTNVNNGQVIYARLVHNEISLCHGISSFRLFIGDYQEPVITAEGTICNNGQLKLTADAGYSTYLWSTGETTRSIFVSEPGVYTVIVEKPYGTEVCDGFAEVEIKASYTPEIDRVDTKDWTKNQNSITVYTKDSGDYLYSVDGINYQEDPEFRGLEPGVYKVYAKDANGCGEVVKDVVLMHYPNFFTPNGDGVHDKWRIKYSMMEPEMKIAIFDRYGKLITAFGPNHEGWDGTLNGIQLPSTDYWFVVTRQDGRELRGHFSMLR